MHDFDIKIFRQEVYEEIQNLKGVAGVSNLYSEINEKKRIKKTVLHSSRNILERIFLSAYVYLGKLARKKFFDSQEYKKRYEEAGRILEISEVKSLLCKKFSKISWNTDEEYERFIVKSVTETLTRKYMASK